MELSTNRRFNEQDLDAAFADWWRAAKPKLPDDADFDEWRFVFLDAYQCAKTPLGSNHIEEALKLAHNQPLPPEAERYTSPRIRLLAAFCFHLQQMVGGHPFFVSVRTAAKVMGVKSPHHGSSMLRGLVRDGVLRVVEQGTPGNSRATRYRFIPSVKLPNQ